MANKEAVQFIRKSKQPKSDKHHPQNTKIPTHTSRLQAAERQTENRPQSKQSNPLKQQTQYKNCGHAHKIHGSCLAKGKTCNHYKKKRHFAHVCRAKKHRSMSAPQPSQISFEPLSSESIYVESLNQKIQQMNKRSTQQLVLKYSAKATLRQR